MKTPSAVAVAAAAVLCPWMPSSFAQDPAATPTGVQPVVVHATAHFDFNRTTVLPADQKSLLAEVATMKDVTWQAVSADGYADSVGKASYNQRLSARRASAVRVFLLGKGLEPRMVEAQGKGASDPVADNGTEEGRAQNRRTEVTFTGVRTVAGGH